MLGGGSRRSEGKKEEAREGTHAAPSREASSGTALTTAMEKQEGLLEQVLSRSGAPGEAEARNELAALHGVLAGLSQKTVIVIFAMGKVLAEVREILNHGEFMPWIEGNCSFHRNSAINYMRVYERYKNEPRKALEELSISDAYIEAGVKKLAAPNPGDDIHQRDGLSLDGEPRPEEFTPLFKKPTLSGVPLKLYRVFPYRDGSLYVVRPETGPVKVCDLFIDMSNKDVVYQDAVQEIHHNMQMALEVFYSKMEECETKGIIATPFDASRGTMAKRMRNVTPEKGKPQAKAIGSRGGKGAKANKGGRK